MKKVTIETNYNVMKELAKKFGINYVGVKKEDLVNMINQKIEESKPKKGGKWYEQEGAFPFKPGDLVILVNHPNKAINGRMVEVVGPSSKRNALKGYLINPKTGGKQKTCLSLDFDMVELYTSQYPMVVNSNLPMVI